jgi:hypothetical protein
MKKKPPAYDLKITCLDAGVELPCKPCHWVAQLLRTVFSLESIDLISDGQGVLYLTYRQKYRDISAGVADVRPCKSLALSNASSS